MKKIQVLIACFSLLMATTACTGDFEDVNEDPNRIAEISPGTLLNPIIYGMSNHNALRSADITFSLMQVSVPFPSVSGGLHRYDVGPGIGNSSWDNSYKWLANIREMRMAAEAKGDNNYLAVALTLNAWVYSNLTDLFGPVPMTEAVRAEDGILYPSYDSQEMIYQTLLADLEKANELYDAGAGMIYASDILFANDVLKWKKFTNSLHMRLLLRISNRTEISAFDKLAAMINNPAQYPVFENTAESAILKVTGVGANVSPWGRPQDFRLNVKMSSFFMDNLNTFADPRRPLIATTGTDLSGNNIGYIGIPSGYDGADSQFEYNASTFQITPITNPMQIVILPYSEVEFIKAEVAQKGYIADAESHYKKGVEGAIQQLKGTMPATYFDNEAVKYNGTLEQIMLQKYYALYFVDYQQWFEYRRTGLPELPTTSAMLNGGIMPSRFTYPPAQQIYNAQNYKEAVQMIGNDNINTKIWWDN